MKEFMFGLFLGLLGTIGSIFLFKNILFPLPVYSPHLLELTSPVNAVTGTIDQKYNDSFTLNVLNVNQKKVTFTIRVDANTSITQPVFPVNYLFRKNKQPQVPLLSVADLQPGMLVQVQTTVDLRTDKNAYIPASHVYIQGTNNLNGRIISIHPSVIEVMGSPTSMVGIVNEAKVNERLYRILVDSNTEISQNVQGVPKRLDVSNLKPNMQIVVYTEEINVSTRSEFPAALIQPLTETPLPTPTP